MKTAAEIRGRMSHLVRESKGLIEKHPDFNFPDDVESTLRQNEKELGELKEQLAKAKSSSDMVERMSAFNEYLTAPADDTPSFPGADGKQGKSDDGQQGTRREQQRAKTLSQLVLTDAKYTKWLKEVAPEGYFSKEVRAQSPQVAVPGGLKALVTGTADGSAGAFVFNDVQRNLDQFVLRRPLTMRDIVTIGQTDSDTVEYVRQVSETNNAAMVPEATSTAPIGDGTGGTVTAAAGGVKPESGMVFERVTTTVKTVAHWMPATKRALADAGQMQTLIDNFLRYGLEEELEDQMTIGNGAGENFTGLANISGTTAQAWDTNVLVTTRKAKTKVRTVGRMAATAYLLNPYDWETIQLTRTEDGGANTGMFFFGGPAAVEVPTLWNLPVVESESVPVGTGFVGNFKTLILWDRQQAGVQMTDSHNDFFVRNLVAILAEARAAFGCLRPAAIVEMDLTAA